MTQSEASLRASTDRNGSLPFRRNWAVDESRAETARDDRTSWQERMGLTVEEALELPGLAGTTVAAGARVSVGSTAGLAGGVSVGRGVG